MTAGTVVITGGILAAVILLTIVTVLCCCRLQYYCCKREESEGEGEEPDVSESSPILPLPPPQYTPNHLLMTAEPYEPNGPAMYTPPLVHDPPPRPPPVCPTCSGYLPFYMHHPDGLRNGGGRISYRTVQQQELDLPMDMPCFPKLNLFHSVTMREVVTHHSISTDV